MELMVAVASRRRLLVVGLVLLSFLALALPRSATACRWTPPPPFCAKSLVLSHAVPEVLLLPGGGSFDVESLVYFAIGSFPAGLPLCPGGPFTVDIDYVLTCTGGGGGTGSLTGAALVTGYNEYRVTVSVPAGPPRLCSIAGVATVLLADGMELKATPKAMPVCIGEPAPGLPSEPRLNLFLMSNNPLGRVHPGDQGGYTYRIVNNDPTETYSGVLTVDMVNTSKMPSATGPMPPGTGLFSISDPGPGDNFPVGFSHHLFDGCLPLPPDPIGFVASTIQEPLLIPPGGFLDVDVFARPWGMCKNGACGQASLVLDGEFSNLDPGLACAGLVAAADIGVPPQFLWTDSGQVGQFPLPVVPDIGLLPIVAAAVPGPPIRLDLQAQNLQLLGGGNPVPGTLDLLSNPFIDGDHGRTRGQFLNDGLPLLPIAGPIDLFGHVEVQPPSGAPITTEIVQLDLVGGPTGFELAAPGAELIVGILPLGVPDFASFFDLTLQFNAFATDENGDQRELFFTTVELLPSGPAGFDFHLAGLVAPGSGLQAMQLDLNLDFHGFAFEAPSPFIFQDGFEGGDFTAWSSTTP